MDSPMTGKSKKQGNTTYNIKNIHAGRDVVLGNQEISTNNTINAISHADFVGELQKILAEMVEIRKNSSLRAVDLKTMKIAEAGVKSAIKEAKKTNPLGARIQTTLDDTQKIMEKMGANVNAALGLGTVLAGLAQTAIRIFGH
jgi:hypothetical protein